MRIYDFALVANWADRLTQLSALAEPERWAYLHVPSDKGLPILDSYLRHTFSRLSDEGKIEETDSLACFNTGLLTPSQEEIYGIFNVADKYDPQSRIHQRTKSGS